jgi:hypothetical protein
MCAFAAKPQFKWGRDLNRPSKVLASLFALTMANNTLVLKQVLNQRRCQALFSNHQGQLLGEAGMKGVLMRQALGHVPQLLIGSFLLAISKETMTNLLKKSHHSARHRNSPRGR